MPVQTQVRPRPRSGAAGTHVTAWSASNAPVNTRALESTPGCPKDVFGRASIRGTTPGETVRIPSATFTADNFEGVIMNNFLIEHDLADSYVIEGGAAVGVCRHGDIWVQVVPGASPMYGSPVHIVTTGGYAGMFTVSGGVAINGMFIGEVSEDGLAPVELRRG